MLLLSKLCNPVALPPVVLLFVSSKLPQPWKRSMVSEDHMTTIEQAALQLASFLILELGNRISSAKWQCLDGPNRRMVSETKEGCTKQK